MARNMSLCYLFSSPKQKQLPQTLCFPKFQNTLLYEYTTVTALRAVGPYHSPNAPVCLFLFHWSKRIFLGSPSITRLLFLGLAAHNNSVSVPIIQTTSKLILIRLKLSVSSVLHEFSLVILKDSCPSFFVRYEESRVTSTFAQKQESNNRHSNITSGKKLKSYLAAVTGSFTKQRNDKEEKRCTKRTSLFPFWLRKCASEEIGKGVLGLPLDILFGRWFMNDRLIVLTQTEQ